VLRIRDVYPGTEFFPSRILDQGSKRLRIRIKEVKFLNRVLHPRVKWQKLRYWVPSVADLGCLSRIPDPDFCSSGSRIPDPKTATKKKGKKMCCPTFLSPQIFQKLKIILVLSRLRKNFGANLQRITYRNLYP
jgi:hypothetical protein